MKVNPFEIKCSEAVDFSTQESVNDIAVSIRDHGMLHPPTIKENLTLVTGRLRVLAARKLGLQEIECTTIPDDTSPDDCMIIHINENLKRYNLPWYDQVILEKQLHDLRQLQNGVGKRGKKTGWSIRNTAEELDMAFGVLSEDIKMADAILMNPTLKKIKDKTTARRVILQQIRQIEQEVKAGTINTELTNKIFYGSSEEVLKVFPDKTFDAVITDPPWLKFKDKTLTRDEFTLYVFKEVFRTLKYPSFLYAFVSTQDFFFYHKELQDIGFSVQDYPLIWIKEGVISLGTKTWEYQRNYELILLAVKGAPALTFSPASPILIHNPLHPSKMIHPNEKPISLIRSLLDHCTYEESFVCDPFAGSGVVGEACKAMGRNYVLIERDPVFHHKIQERMKE